MCRFSGTDLHAREKSIKMQSEINLVGHFLHSCFELTLIEISQGHVEGHLTIAVSLPTWAIHYVQFKSLGGEQLAVQAFYEGAQNAHVGQI